MAQATFTAEQVQNLFDTLAGAMPRSTAKALLASLSQWQKECVRDDTPTPEIAVVAEGLRQGWLNFHGDNLN